MQKKIKPVEIWLVRHGTTRSNLEGRIQGKQDVPLCEQGKQEARRLAAYLKNTGFAAVFSSPLLRAKETAETVLEENLYRSSTEIIFLEELKEYGWGALEGYTWKEIKEAWPCFYRDLQQNFWGIAVNGRESRETFLERVKVALDHTIYRPSFYGRLLVISHGRLINAFITYSLGLDINGRWPFSPACASLSVLKIDSSLNNGKLHLFNKHCYL